MSAVMSDDLSARLAEQEVRSQKIYQAMCKEAVRLGFALDELTLSPPQKASYRLEKDPADSQFSLVGNWSNEQGYKIGTLLFHADGSFFVEQDIVKQHPEKPKWFVEAINAWGRDDSIKVEARLIPMP